ncbi:MAG: class I SAM-dependent methyltransferase [Planktomarina sp.]
MSDTAHRNWAGKYEQFVIPGQEDIARQALTHDFQSVLDVGAGNLCASAAFVRAGKTVSATVNNSAHYDVHALRDDITFHENVQIENFKLPGQTFDAVWCAHVVEHTMNPGLAIQSMRDLLNDDGVLFLSVPPFKDQVVGGHLSVGWNLGILIYFLLMSGFDVKNGSFVWHGYNVTAFVRKAPKQKFNVMGDAGDIEKLRPYFPDALNAKQGFEGRIENINWDWQFAPRLKHPPHRYIPQYR